MLLFGFVLFLILLQIVRRGKNAATICVVDVPTMSNFHKLIASPPPYTKSHKSSQETKESLYISPDLKGQIYNHDNPVTLQIMFFLLSVFCA